MGIQYLNGYQFYMGFETSAGERLLKITSRDADNIGGITFNTGSGATERVRITNNHTTIQNLLVVEETPRAGVDDSPIYRLSESILEPNRMILSPLTFVKIYEPVGAYENWNGITIQNVLNLPVQCNVLIQGYMSFYTNTQGRRSGIVRLTHISTGTTYFVEATKFFNIIQSHECVPINEMLYNMYAGSWNLFMFTLAGSFVDLNDRAFISATIFT